MNGDNNEMEIEDINSMKQSLTDFNNKLTEQRQSLIQKKELIAKLATTIIETPETQMGKLKELQELCTDTDITVKKLSIISVLKIYKDILPGYHIRELTEKELAIKISKEVRQLRDYEFTLLRSYQSYLQILENLEHADRKKK